MNQRGENCSSINTKLPPPPAKAIPLPPCAPGSLLLVLDTGAYGAVMASNYNMRGRALEVLVEGAGVRVVGAREGYSHVMDRFRKLNN